MSESTRIPFSCASCGADYEIVPIEASPKAQNEKARCGRCFAPFPAAEGKVSIKYLPVKRPNSRI